MSKLLKQTNFKESETLELKSSLTQVKEIIETISAFSNTKGGRIIIGVSDSGRILGVEIGKATIEKLTNQIHQGLDPKVYPRIKTQKANSRNIVIVEVKESLDKLVLAFGRPFKRVGKSTLRMSKDEYERSILEKYKDKLQFDKQICKGTTLKDINTQLIRDFLKRAKFERRLELDLELSATEVLKKLNLIEKGKLTNAALLLFGKNPQKFFLQAEVKCARFKGIDPLEFIDMKVFGGNIIDQRDDTLEFAKEHIELHAEIKGTERVEKWEYPIEAIREAITNAICHRDYGIPSSIQIRIFDDRIEVWGCGPLPDPLTPEDLRRKHRSILRNPLIGRCFFLIKYIEEWGTGTNRMIKTCLDEGLPEPLFKEISHGVAERTLRKDLDDLVKMGIIKPVGEKKGRKYVFK